MNPSSPATSRATALPCADGGCAARRRSSSSWVSPVWCCRGLVTTVAVGTRTANALCANMVTYYVGEGTSSVARWEFFGPGVIGWECYSGGFGGEKHVSRHSE